jgi:hypothetical protein
MTCSMPYINAAGSLRSAVRTCHHLSRGTKLSLLLAPMGIEILHLQKARILVSNTSRVLDVVGSFVGSCHDQMVIVASVGAIDLGEPTLLASPDGCDILSSFQIVQVFEW